VKVGAKGDRGEFSGKSGYSGLRTRKESVRHRAALANWFKKKQEKQSKERKRTLHPHVEGYNRLGESSREERNEGAGKRRDQQAPSRYSGQERRKEARSLLTRDTELEAWDSAKETWKKELSYLNRGPRAESDTDWDHKKGWRPWQIRLQHRLALKKLKKTERNYSPSYEEKEANGKLL